MNKIGVGILSGTIGFVIGAIGTYILLKKKMEDAYYQELHNAIDEECDRLRKAHKEAVGATIEDAQIQEKIFEKPNVEVKDEVVNQYKVALETAYGGAAPEEITPDTTEGPRFIDEDEYRFLPPKYEIRELQYYCLDGVFLDVNDEIVDNPDIYISGLKDELDKMGDYTSAFILIESIGVAVEVVVFQRSYSETFGGVY